jgi:hypothetical protein
MVVGDGLDMKFSCGINRWLQITSLFLSIVLIHTATGIQAESKAVNVKTRRSEKECTMMDISRQFAILTHINRGAYQYERDALLGSPQDLNTLIADNAARPEWHNQVQAEILKGWLQHREMYASILRELEAVNVEQESKTVVGISRIWDAYALKAQKKYGRAVLPLAWEAILKFESYWPDWKVITFLKMIAAVPDVQSIEPILWLLESTDNEHLRHAAGKTLSKLPQEAVKLRIQQLTEKLGRIRQVIDDTLYEME